MSTSEKTLIALFVLVGILGFFYFKGLRIEKEKEQAIVVEASRRENAFGDIHIEAKAAYVYDVHNDKALYSKNADVPLPLASITKVMTAFVALDSMPNTAIVAISPQALKEEGDSGLFAGELWNLSDLARFALISSSNDAAKAISISVSERLEKPIDYSGNVFVREMNEKAKSLGLSNTIFHNETGLDSPDLSLSGAYGTAKEVAKFFLSAVEAHPDVFEATSKKNSIFVSASGFRHNAKNTNEIIDLIPSAISSKTGFTDLAGGNLVVLFDVGPLNPIVVSVLGSSSDGRFKDMEKLINATVKYISSGQSVIQ